MKNIKFLLLIIISSCTINYSKKIINDVPEGIIIDKTLEDDSLYYFDIIIQTKTGFTKIIFPDKSLYNVLHVGDTILHSNNKNMKFDLYNTKNIDKNIKKLDTLELKPKKFVLTIDTLR